MKHKEKGYCLPEKVTICEVAPRDGFQAEEEWIPTEEKIRIVRRLAETGVSSMEITSFVHPQAIPQLKDAGEVVRAVQDLTDIQFRALVPNAKGAERAAEAGIKKFKLMLSATDSHSLSNANSRTFEAMEKFHPILELAEKENVTVSGSISVAFGCPYEGNVPVKRIQEILNKYSEMGIMEVSLADTTGMANPRQVYEMLGILQENNFDMEFSMHLHNTRGMAFANAVAAMQQGVTKFDSSIAGLGGCPYAPGATGNIASEDLVHSLHEMGVDTGINMEKLINTAKDVYASLGHHGGSFILEAGPNSELHEKPAAQEKITGNN
jgi:hydroxymethylglutaryl-CoA lyase